jgi:hypothetical protein
MSASAEKSHVYATRLCGQEKLTGLRAWPTCEISRVIKRRTVGIGLAWPLLQTLVISARRGNSRAGRVRRIKMSKPSLSGILVVAASLLLIPYSIGCGTTKTNTDKETSQTTTYVPQAPPPVVVQTPPTVIVPEQSTTTTVEKSNQSSNAADPSGLNGNEESSSSYHSQSSTVTTQPLPPPPVTTESSTYSKRTYQETN